jgi:hypothetical protein
MQKYDKICKMLEKMSPGTLVIYFPDGNKVEISERIVRENADKYWKSHSLNDIKATMLTRCAFCSKGNDTFCDAVGSIFPVLPFFDGYLSHQPVRIEYWESETGYLTLESTLQVVLEYIVRLSIFEYCDATQKFKEFFRGIALFSDNIEEIAEQIRKNVFWAVKGNAKAYKKKLKGIEQVLRITTENKLNRFRMMLLKNTLKMFVSEKFNRSMPVFLPYLKKWKIR